MAQLMWQELERQRVDAFYDVEDIRVGRIADVIDRQLTALSLLHADPHLRNARPLRGS